MCRLSLGYDLEADIVYLATRQHAASNMRQETSWKTAHCIQHLKILHAVRHALEMELDVLQCHEHRLVSTLLVTLVSKK